MTMAIELLGLVVISEVGVFTAEKEIQLVESMLSGDAPALSTCTLCNAKGCACACGRAAIDGGSKPCFGAVSVTEGVAEGNAKEVEIVEASVGARCAL